jgi:diguanylate cyclase (GGDEF)-like protein/PAS domain S-box-containing protein
MREALANADLLLLQHVTPTFVLDPQGRVTVWNQACEKLTGLKEAEVIGTRDHWRGFYTEARPCLADLILQDRIEAVEEYYVVVSDVQVSRGAIAAENWCVMPISGRRLYLAVEAVAIRDVAGEMIGVLETLRDLSAMKEAESKFRSLAGIDALTGVANRRTFNDVLGSEWRRAIRSGVSLSLLMIDVDHFKLFNDSLGHQSGDECLRIVAEAIAGEAHRAGDFPARYGGEEFVMVLPATDKAGTAVIAENVRAAIERRGILHPLSSAGPFVTASIGTATVAPTNADRVEKLICFADIALYRAKEQGRNQVCPFHDGPSCAVARRQPTAGIAIPDIDCNGCASCRAAAPKTRLHA